MKLTAKATARLVLPAGKTDHFAWDDALPGFGYRLRRAAGGKISRSWTVQYRHGGASRRMSQPAEVLGAEQARAWAKKLLAKAAIGEDPQGDKQDRRGRDRVTMGSLVPEYLAAKQPRLRPRSFVETQRYLTSGYFKPLHNMPLDTITRRDVAARVVVIMRENGSPTAALARAALSGFFVWSMQMGLAENNPTIGSTKPIESEPRERVLTDAELSRIWNGCADDDHGKCIRLLILTGCRRQEIGGMCWSELDLERGTWTLPAGRSKNGRSHVLPLLPAMLDIIKAAPRMVARDQLFGTRGGGFTAWSGGKAVLDQRSKVEGWTTHDIRRSVATKLGDIGVLPHLIEQILNHQSGHRRGPAGVYNKSIYEREVRSALALWHDHIRVIVEGGERKILQLTQSAS